MVSFACIFNEPDTSFNAARSATSVATQKIMLQGHGTARPYRIFATASSTRSTAMISMPAIGCFGLFTFSNGVGFGLNSRPAASVA